MSRALLLLAVLVLGCDDSAPVYWMPDNPSPRFCEMIDLPNAFAQLGPCLGTVFPAACFEGTPEGTLTCFAAPEVVCWGADHVRDGQVDLVDLDWLDRVARGCSASASAPSSSPSPAGGSGTG